MRGGAGGAGGGVCGGPPPGRRPAAAGRISTAAVRRDRLRDGWEGPAGKVARGGPPLSRGRGTNPPECYSPPAAAFAESRGRGSQTRRRALPPPGAHLRGGLPPARGGVTPAEARRCSGGAGPPLPRRDRSPTPPAPGDGARGGAGRTVLSAPRASRAVGPGGFFFAKGKRATPRSEASARGRRRCRPPTRPVLKHGPRSLTRARVRGSHESRRGAMKVKAPPPAPPAGGGPRWDPEASPVRRGRTTGPSRPHRRGGGA